MSAVRNERKRAIERASQKRRREKDPVGARAKARSYYANNRDKQRLYFKGWADDNRDKVRAAKAKWRLKSKDKIRSNNLFKKYGITLEQWNAMFAAQGHRCKICPSVEPRSKTGWHTDHDHETDAVRGILCHGCNHLLGAARDNPETLRAAASYLEGNK